MNRRALLASLLSLAGTPAFAWKKPKLELRLLNGERRGGQWLAGLGIELDEGWKTYWRVPGDSGVPPEFDWSRSANLKHVEILWPAPRRYHDAAGETIGYKSRVILPLLVTPEDPSMPVTLDLKAFFAICKDVCIPGKARASLALKTEPATAGLIATYEQTVPQPGNAVSAAYIEDIDGQPALALTTTSELPADTDIFVEGFESAYFRAPRKHALGYILPIDGLKQRDALRGRTLKLTIVGARKALEQSIVVD